MTIVDDTFQILRISSDDIPERDRLEFVREVYGRTIIKHDLEPIPGIPFQLSGTMRRLPSLGLASLASPGMFTRRGRAQCESDDLLLNVTLAGGRVLRQLGREAVIGEGEAVLSTSAEVGTCDIHADSRWVSIRIPFSTLAPMIEDLGAVLIRPIAAGTGSLPLLVNYIAALQDTHSLVTPELHRLIAAHVTELVALTVGATRDAAEIARGSGLRAARLVRVLQAIDAGVLDASLSAASVAARLGVTPRYVHLLLEETGQTFSQYVLEKRLVRAMQLLRDPRHCGRRIADVAFAVGFADLSHFNRAFRLRFGNTPSSIRKNAARGEGRW